MKPLVPLPNRPLHLLNAIEIAAKTGNGNMIKVLAPLIENPNMQNMFDGVTPMHLAASTSCQTGSASASLDVLKVLGTFTRNFNVVDGFGETLMHSAAIYGNVNILRFLAPLMENPSHALDDYGSTPLDIARIYRNYEFITILQTYIK